MADNETKKRGFADLGNSDEATSDSGRKATDEGGEQACDHKIKAAKFIAAFFVVINRIHLLLQNENFEFTKFRQI